MNGFPNQPQPKWPDEQQKIGTGEGESPLASPPPPKTEMRTMGSDVQSLQDTGGQNAKPYAPPPPQEPVFQPPQPEAPPSQQPPAGIAVAPMEPVQKGGKKKTFLVTLIVILVIVGLAALGYFVVYPALFPTTEEVAEAPLVTPPPAVEPPPVIPPPIIVPPEPSADILPVITAHLSLFKTPADASLEVILPDATLASFRSAVSAAPVQTNSFNEIVIKNSLGQPISFYGLMPLLLPNFFTTQTLSYFEEDATLFVYSVDRNLWSGFIAKLKTDAKVNEIQGKMSAIQKDSDNKNLFLTNPGEIGIWRDGKIANKPASLVDFSKPGATLGYTWLEKNLLITTNLAGGDEAAKRLGF